MKRQKTILQDPTPTYNELPLREAKFSSLAEALDYAAQGVTGCNFYRGGTLSAVLPYAALREKALRLAHRLCSLQVKRGDRVALVADTDPDFLVFFFACQYAGLVPVPLPAFVHMGGSKAYVEQLRRLLIICDAKVAFAPKGFIDFLINAAEGLDLGFIGVPEAFAELPDRRTTLRPLEGEDLAYLQYTSGSTRFPRGVMITQSSLMSNLQGIAMDGINLRQEDRCVSWLPFYHDMGLVGMILSPVATQRSIDYLNTRDFAMRPRQWLSLMTQNRATISIGPPFGYELCARRVKREDTTAFDLRSWRVAGVGAEMIRPDTLDDFSSLFAPCGFKKEAFLACYGMAECGLAVSFAPLDSPLQVDHVDGEQLSYSKKAVPLEISQKGEAGRTRTFVKCGLPLPQYEVEVRDEAGRSLPDRHCGILYVRGPSIMRGYFGDEKETCQVLSPEGWLCTGDIAYRVAGSIVITGREKDIIIINGRNIWPQDLEMLAQEQPEVRTGDAAAFAVSGDEGEEKAVMMVECREADVAKRNELIRRLNALILEELGIDCLVCLVPRNALPRTTSGKLSRSEARRKFLERFGEELKIQPAIDFYDQAV